MQLQNFYNKPQILAKKSFEVGITATALPVSIQIKPDKNFNFDQVLFVVC